MAVRDIERLFGSGNAGFCRPVSIVLVEAKGLNVPFKRPKSLSDDFTVTGEVPHAPHWYKKNVGKVDYMLTVYPTVVLFSEGDLITE